MSFDSASFLSRVHKVFLCLFMIGIATSISVTEGAAFGLLILMVLRLWKEGVWAKERLPPHLIPLMAFVGIVLLGILLGEASPSSVVYDIRRMRFFLYYVVFYFSVKSVPRQQWLLPLVLITSLVGVYAVFQHFIPLDLVRPYGKKIIQYAIEQEKIGPLVLGTFNHHLTFSNVYLLFASLFFGLGLGRGVRRNIYLPLGVLLFVLCIWTQSRAAWIAIPFSVLAIVWGKGWKTVLGMVTFCVIVLLGSYAGDSGFRERLNRTLFVKNDFYQLGPRIRLWEAQWEMFKGHPFIGVGYNNNERKAKVYVDRLYPNSPDNFYGHAHSTPLQILSTTGTLGVLAYLWVWLSLFSRLRSALRLRDSPDDGLARGILGAFVGFHIQGLTQWNFGDAEVLYPLMFFWALAANLNIARRLE